MRVVRAANQNRRFRLTKLWFVGALAIGPLAGCYKPLFPENAPRTQFENYDRMRQNVVPLQEPDVFGNMQPALRARLTPRQ